MQVYSPRTLTGVHPLPVLSLTQCTCDSTCTFQLSHHGGSTSLKTPSKRHSEKPVPVPCDTFIRKPSPCGIFWIHWHQGPESSEIQAHWALAFLAYVSSSRSQGRHRRCWQGSGGVPPVALQFPWSPMNTMPNPKKDGTALAGAWGWFCP